MFKFLRSDLPFFSSPACASASRLSSRRGSKGKSGKHVGKMGQLLGGVANSPLANQTIESACVPLWEDRWCFGILSGLWTQELQLTTAFTAHFTAPALPRQKEIKQELKHCSAAFALSFFKGCAEQKPAWASLTVRALLGRVRSSQILNWFAGNT